MEATLQRVSVTEKESQITCNIAVHTMGRDEKPPVFCVHGLTRNAKDFYHLAHALAEDFYVIMPDMPGRGSSDNLPHPALYNNGFYALLTAQLFETMKLRPCYWVGTSMGGIIGMIHTAMHKESVLGLLLNDIGSIIPKPALERIKSYVGVNHEAPEFSPLANVVRSNLIPFGIEREDIREHFIHASITSTPSGGYRLNYDPAIAVAFAELPEAGVDLTPLWQSIECPVLLIRGEHSDILSKDVAHAMVNSHPHVTYWEAPSAGHAPSLTRPQEIAQVKNWLKKLNAQGMA